MNRKRVISLILAALLAMTPIMNVYAQPKEDEQSSDTQSDTDTGTEEPAITSVEDAQETFDSYADEELEWKEIYIDSVEDLNAFSRNCWLDTWSQNKKVYLTKDLNLAGSDFVSIPTFGGLFDGQGHTISGLSLDGPVSYTGLFCYIQQTGADTNLNVKGAVNPEGKQVAVGGIAGDNSGIIMDCTFEGIVEGNDYTGGIAGFNELTGIIINCTSRGIVKGVHYTGGIVGENIGNIVGCVNEAGINTSNEDKQMSLDDINLEQYTSELFSLTDSDESGEKASAVNSTVDSGGIAGLSTGMIQYSTNKGMVGYEHVGYNAGGIVGRQSGYVWFCENTASVYGRKDVGGITGQAEPYIAVDLTEDIAFQLSENINELHDLIDQMLEDAGTESETVSNRLSVIQSFADKALDDTSVLADKTVEWADGMIGSANEIFDRTDFIMGEMARNDGPIDDTKNAAGNVKDAASELGQAVDDLDIYDYMTQEERERYDAAKDNMQNATESYSEAYADYVKAKENTYINDMKDDSKYQSQSVTEDDLKPYINAEWQYTWDSTTEVYAQVEKWAHVEYQKDENGVTVTDAEGNPVITAVYVLGGAESPNSAQNDMDRVFLEDVARKMQDNADTIDKEARQYAEDKYGGNYTADMADWLDTMSGIILAHADEMSDNTREHLEEAVSDVGDAAGNLESAGGSVEDIFNNLNDRLDIQLPLLGADYRSRTSSLAANLQGISENMGYLNSEMLSTSDVMREDMEAVNDQFSSIMLLYTDAIDGVLDMDYSSAYEDNSEEDAEESVDATIADCRNSGEVRGDLNVAGIAGTMAIEYDFDLESDVTGIDDAKANSTFLTKCVLRQNENSGKVTAQKSYAGGVCGLQEMGIILRCGGYGKVQSTTGNYVGGVAGQSYSYIKNSFAKCMVSGGDYVAGIVGAGSRIEDCYAMVKIVDATSFFGAIAGSADVEGNVSGNYFVSDEIAGIDRISYSKKAEPISYQELIAVEGIPQRFRKMKITFYADEQEVSQLECRYGGSISEDKYPDIPVKKGFYADWDINELNNVMFDQEVTVEYVRYLTTLAGSRLRENGQSAILVDGNFKESDELGVMESTVSDIVIEDVSPEDIVEHWAVRIPEDGDAIHQIRYQAPLSRTKDVEIYVKSDNGWQKAETELMGIYHLFPVHGTRVEIAVTIHEKSIRDYLVFIIIGGAAVIAGIVVVIAVKKKRKKKK